MLTNSSSFSGGRLQWGISPLPPSEEGRADKEFLLIPVVSAGPEGGHGMLNIRTNLGHAHRLEAMLDTQFNVTGRYKFIHAPWVLKPSFQVSAAAALHTHPSSPPQPYTAERSVSRGRCAESEKGRVRIRPRLRPLAAAVLSSPSLLLRLCAYVRVCQSIPSQGEEMALEVDYRGAEFFAQVNLLGNLSQAVLSYNRSLTPRWSAGVQLHSALGMVNFLNFTTRYTSEAGDVVALTHKNAQLLASYHRVVFEQPATPQFPALSLSLATELRVHTAQHVSEWAVGLQHQRAMFKYLALITSQPAVAVMLEQNLGGAVLQLTGEIKYDGSNESKFGIGLMI